MTTDKESKAALFAYTDNCNYEVSVIALDAALEAAEKVRAEATTKREEKLREALKHCNNVIKEHIEKPEPIDTLMPYMKGAQQRAEEAL